MDPHVSLKGFSDLEAIGRGGMSTVYRAYQQGLDRVVAIKFLDHPRGAEVEAQQSVEARLAAIGTAHPNLVTILQVGVATDGRHYIVMPYYPSGSLQDRLTAHGPLDIEAVLRIGVKLASAIATLHRHDIVHGDIKPSNVLLDAFGDVVLADFGVARRLDHAAPSPPLGVTPAYAAPEVFDDQPQGTASDIYSLGMTLLTLAEGRSPVAGITYVWQEAPGREDRRQMRADLPAPFRAIIFDCLSEDPSERPDALTLGRRIQQVQKDLGLPMTQLVVVDDPLVEPPPSAVRDPDPTAGAAAPPLGVQGLDAPAAPGLLPPAGPPPAAPPSGRPGPSLESSDRGTRREKGRREKRRPEKGRRWRRSRPPTPPPSGSPSLGMLTPDRPTAQDRLGQEPLVLGIGRLLDDPFTALPLTIGISGPWGAGKSSLMLQLARYLTADTRDSGARRWDVVHFDAWRFQGREAIWVGLARAIHDQCQGTGRLRRALFRMRLEVRRRGALRAGAAVVVLAAVLILGTSVAVHRLIGGDGFIVSAAFAAAALTSVTVAVTYLGVVGEPFTRTLQRNAPGRAFEDFLGISLAAERDIDCLLRTVASPESGRAVIVLLDDLDRCSPATITETLATITEVFGKHADRSVAFVLGVDLDIVASAVGSTLRDIATELTSINPRRATELRENYLEKIFQLSVTVTGRSDRSISHLLIGTADQATPSSASTDHTGPGERPSDGAARVQRWSDRLGDAGLRNPDEVTLTGLATRGRTLSKEEMAALRELMREARASLLSATSTDVRQAEIAALRPLSLTPRAIKRFDNAFRLQLQVANGTPGSQLDYSRQALVALAKWVALRMFFPRLCRLIDREPGLLGELEDLANDADGLDLARRLHELCPDAPPEVTAEATALLRAEMPQAAITRLRLDTFAHTT